MDHPIDVTELTRLFQQHVDSLNRAYAEAMEKTGWDGVVIHSGSPKSRSMFDDQYWPLRITPHFQHWLPLNTARSALSIQPGQKPRLLWRNAFDFWEAPPEPEHDHFWAAFDVKEMTTPDASMKELLPTGGKIAFIGEDDADADDWGFSADQIRPAELLRELDGLRIRKTAYEKLCLDEANRRACLGHDSVFEAFKNDDLSELQLHLLYLETTCQDDPFTPYKNIVALGEHAATLHHVAYSTRREGSQSLLLDAGASFLGYDSDITRTGVKGEGDVAATFAELIQRMEVLQLELCSRVKTGVPYEQLHNQSHELLAPVLRDLGIARGSDDELVSGGITRKFLPHGLGHSLGLQTHDVGCAQIKPEPRNPFLRNTSTVEPGQVFTIEPGCYFISGILEPFKATSEGKAVDWNLVDQLRKFGGVRIEDDIAVTEEGSVNLTRAYLED